MNKELKPCPFCKSNAFPTTSHQNTHGLEEGFVKCKNHKCGALITAYGLDEAIKRWNTRVQS